jgi:hypothetical protein
MISAGLPLSNLTTRGDTHPRTHVVLAAGKTYPVVEIISRLEQHQSLEQSTAPNLAPLVVGQALLATGSVEPRAAMSRSANGSPSRSASRGTTTVPPAPYDADTVTKRVPNLRPPPVSGPASDEGR